MALSVEKAMSLAKAHERKREYDQARQIYAAVLQQFPNNARARKALNALGGGAPAGPGIDLPPQHAQALIGFLQQGRFEQVLAAAAKLVASHPSSAFLAEMTGIANASLGRFAEAEGCFRKVIEVVPGSAGAHSNLGNTLKEQGKLDQAAECYQRAIERDVNLADAYNGLGVVQLEQGSPEEAAANLRRAVAIKPDYAEAHSNLGNALSELGDFHQAVASYARALKFEPGFASAHNNIGAAYEALDRLEEAAGAYAQAIRLAPGVAEAHNSLGTVLYRLHSFPEAAESYRRALEIKPDYADASNNLGNTLHEMGAYDAAIESYTCAIEIDPGFARAHSNLAATYHVLGNFEEAVSHCEKALSIQPDLPEALTKLGLIYASWGRMDEASNHYRQSIESNPEHTITYMLYGDINTFEEGDPLIGKMEDVSASADLSSSDRAHLDFALAKAYHDLGNTDAAFRLFKEANHLCKAIQRYDFDLSRSLFSELKETFSPSRGIAEIPQAERCPAHHVPIFILGMPRSGTTLVEQIVSGHANVHSAGELDDLARTIGAMREKHAGDHAAVLKGVREGYLQRLEKLGADERFIIDKTPLNFRWIGYIACAFPEAKIVNMVRDPRAVCWSNFRQLFEGPGNGFAYDLEDVANYHVMYSDLMDFWRSRFPGRIHDVDYRALTENPETHARALFEFLELDWQADFLDFHKRKDMVRTVSKAQVRRKIYTGSSEEWRRYEAHLGPMIRILEAAGLI